LQLSGPFLPRFRLSVFPSGSSLSGRYTCVHRNAPRVHVHRVQHAAPFPLSNELCHGVKEEDRGSDPRSEQLDTEHMAPLLLKPTLGQKTLPPSIPVCLSLSSLSPASPLISRTTAFFFSLFFLLSFSSLLSAAPTPTSLWIDDSRARGSCKLCRPIADRSSSTQRECEYCGKCVWTPPSFPDRHF